MRSAARICLISLLVSDLIEGFAPTSCSSFSNARLASTELNFGIPSFLTPGDNNDDDDDNDQKGEESLVKKEVGLKGLVQLITAGAGAPFLGDYQGIDEETGNFMFSLEANNLVDEKGNSKQTSMPYFESGWVDPEEEAKAAKRREEGFKFPWQK